jgi:hypothetical protein
MMTEPFRISGNHRITAQLILTVLGLMLAHAATDKPRTTTVRVRGIIDLTRLKPNMNATRPVNDYRRLRGNCTPTPN